MAHTMGMRQEAGELTPEETSQAWGRVGWGVMCRQICGSGGHGQAMILLFVSSFVFPGGCFGLGGD